MDLLLKTYKNLTKKDYENLWEKALFVFDTNVLLDLYRLPETASKDLIKILSDKKINDRVWIPFQVILEFFNNRTSTISSQKNKFNEVRRLVNNKIQEIENLYSDFKIELDKLQIKKRHSVIDPDTCINEELFKEPLGKLNSYISELDKLDEKHIDVTDKDDLQNQILKIFKNKIGDPPTNNELEKIYKEGEERYKQNRPPGYKDSAKPEIYYFEERKFIQKFGDLLLWKDLIKKAKDESLEFIVLVTGDKKEDWLQEKRGKKLGVRVELLNEIYSIAETVKIFYICDTSNFMKNAKKLLDIDIKENSIEEINELHKLNSIEYKSDPNYKRISLEDIFIRMETHFSDLHISYDGEIARNIIFTMLYSNLMAVFLEVFSNVSFHSTDNIAYITTTETDEYFEITIINRIEYIPEKFTLFHQRGRLTINSLLSKYESYVNFAATNDSFMLTLNINRKYIINRN